MSKVELELQEWQQVIALLANASWRDANPLIMKIGHQLQQQTLGGQMQPGYQSGKNSGEDQEASHGEQRH